MRVLKTKIGAIHNIQGRIAFMQNTVDVVLIESIPPVFLSVCYCCLYISVVEFTYRFIFSG